LQRDAAMGRRIAAGKTTNKELLKELDTEIEEYNEIIDKIERALKNSNNRQKSHRYFQTETLPATPEPPKNIRFSSTMPLRENHHAQPLQT
jgi:hypothetical protein